jgi:hypothetical protein
MVFNLFAFTIKYAYKSVKHKGWRFLKLCRCRYIEHKYTLYVFLGVNLVWWLRNIIRKFMKGGRKRKIEEEVTQNGKKDESKKRFSQEI